MMEHIGIHDQWKTAIPTQDDINELEIKLLERGLADCPFCLARPFFEDSAHVANIFVACHCGARISGEDYQDAAAKWNTRPAPIARKVLREGPRAYWPGA
jgi:hypothetical protein